MKAAPRTSHPISVHSTPTRVLGAVSGAFCALLAVNLVFTGTPAAIWGFLPWLLLAGWAVYVLLWRPCLKVTPDAVHVRNILRDHTVPFSELKAVRVVQTTSFDTTAGRIPSWGAPGAGKLGPRMQSTPTGARTMQQPHTKVVVQSAWEAWEHRQPEKHDGASPSQPHQPSQPNQISQPNQQRKVVSGWNVPSVVVGFILVALVVASVLT